MYPPHNSSSVHQTTTTYVQHTGRTTKGERSGWTTLRDTALSSGHQHPPCWNDPSKKNLGPPQSPPYGCRTLQLFEASFALPLLLAQIVYCLLCGLCLCSRRKNVDHVVFQCPIHRPPSRLQCLTVLDDEAIEWLLNTCPVIQCGQAVVRRCDSNEEEARGSPLFFSKYLKTSDFLSLALIISIDELPCKAQKKIRLLTCRKHKICFHG